MKKTLLQFGLLSLLSLIPVLSWADFSTLEVVLSTPLSSRINHVGNPIHAVLGKSVTLNGQDIPTGTRLLGEVTAVEPSTKSKRHHGRLQLLFHTILLPSGQVATVSLVPDTPDGWLSRADLYLTACKIMPNHSTRLLNTMVRRRLPADRSLWTQSLGINSSFIPEPDTDEFIQEYNRNDVLLGAGDWLRLRDSQAPSSPYSSEPLK